MLARSHIKTGAAAVVVLGSAGIVSFTDPLQAATAIGLVLFGSIAPDIDHGGSTVTTAWIVGRPKASFQSATGKRVWRWTRKWWPGSPWVSWVMRQIAVLVYRATRGPDDDLQDDGAHRKLWHTAIGCVLLGGAASWGMSQLPRWGAAIAVALAVGCVGQAFGRWWKWLAAVVAGLVAWSQPGLVAAWPIWWGAISLGCAVHCAGDGCSRSGVPWTWPALRDGKRWGARHVLPKSLRFVTGGWGERVVLGVMYAAVAAIVWPAVEGFLP